MAPTRTRTKVGEPAVHSAVIMAVGTWLYLLVEKERDYKTTFVDMYGMMHAFDSQ